MRPTPLHLAARNGHLEIVKILMEAAKDKNPSDGNKFTPLDYAKYAKQLHVVEYLESCPFPFCPVRLQRV